jgi:RNA polymerase sigma factor (sigma-70 family)
MDPTRLQQNLLLRADRLRRHIAAKLPEGLRTIVAPDDVLQEVFVLAFQQTRNFDLNNLDSFDAWITMITNQCVADTIKRHRRLKRGGHIRHIRAALDESSCLNLFNLLALPGETPSSEVAIREAVTCLRLAVAALPDDQRIVVEMHHFEGRSYEAISSELHKSVPAVRGLLQRAVRTLRTDLGRASRFFSDASRSAVSVLQKEDPR